MFCGAIAEAFGRGTLYTVGLIFLPVIFFPLLAFSGKTVYVREQTSAGSVLGNDTLYNNAIGNALNKVNTGNITELGQNNIDRNNSNIQNLNTTNPSEANIDLSSYGSNTQTNGDSVQNPEVPDFDLSSYGSNTQVNSSQEQVKETSVQNSEVPDFDLSSYGSNAQVKASQEQVKETTEQNSGVTDLDSSDSKKEIKDSIEEKINPDDLW
jgi:hypothetical protein